MSNTGKRWTVQDRDGNPIYLTEEQWNHNFDDLPDEVNHIVAIVLFGFEVDNHGRTVSNNYLATAFFKNIQEKR